MLAFNNIGMSCERGIEIQRWLNETKYEIESFVILDDDSDMLHLSEKLVKTKGTRGLTEKEAKEAIDMLNKGG